MVPTLGEHADVLDQLARLLDGLGCAVGIVELREVDLAAVDALLFVDHLEIADHGAPAPAPNADAGPLSGVD